MDCSVPFFIPSIPLFRNWLALDLCAMANARPAVCNLLLDNINFIAEMINLFVWQCGNRMSASLRIRKEIAPNGNSIGCLRVPSLSIVSHVNKFSNFNYIKYGSAFAVTLWTGDSFARFGASLPFCSPLILSQIINVFFISPFRFSSVLPHYCWWWIVE